MGARTPTRPASGRVHCYLRQFVAGGEHRARAIRRGRLLTNPRHPAKPYAGITTQYLSAYAYLLAFTLPTHSVGRAGVGQSMPSHYLNGRSVKPVRMLALTIETKQFCALNVGRADPRRSCRNRLRSWRWPVRPDCPVDVVPPPGVGSRE